MFRTFYKNFMPVSTGFVVLAIIIILGVIFARPAGDNLGYAVLLGFAGWMMVIGSIFNVVLSFIALNRKSFQDWRDRRFARIIFWINVLAPFIFIAVCAGFSNMGIPGD